MTAKRRVDVVGLLMMILWIAALQIMLDKGEDEDWFNSPFICGLLVTAVVGFVAFLIWELTDKNPIINLKVFASRSYTICLIVMCFCFGAYFAAVVILPLWLQTNLGYTASWAGFAVAPSGVFAIIVSPIVARMMGKVDPRLLIFIGVLGLASTMLWRAGFASNINFGAIVVPQFLQGIFVPLFFVPLFGTALSTLKPEELAGGAGLLAFTRTMAGAFGTSLSTTVWSNGGRSGRQQLLNQLDSASAVDQLTRTGLSHGQALGQFEAMVQGQAVMLATDKLFLWIAALMVLAACSIWFAAKPSGQARGGGGH